MRHISAILLTLPDGRIVFQRRDNNTPISPGLLGFFGGHVEKDESHDEAMIRELTEETSLDIHSLKWGFVQDFILKPRDEEVSFHLYWAEIPHAEFGVYEGDGAEVYSREQALKRTDLAPSAHHVLTNILKEKK
jgi:8-oxo-dGTP pyrophosphatase MutT (NUDIX family)